MPIVYAWTREPELVLYGKSYITWIRASYTWQYVKRNILPRFYGISHACANSGAQAIFSLPRKKRPGNEASQIPTAGCMQPSLHKKRKACLCIKTQKNTFLSAYAVTCTAKFPPLGRSLISMDSVSPTLCPYWGGGA